MQAGFFVLTQQFSQCYAGRLDYVDHCLAFCSQLLGQVVTGPLDAASGRQVEKLLMVPLESLSLQVLNLEHYPELMQFLHWESRKVHYKTRCMLSVFGCSGTGVCVGRCCETAPGSP